MRECPLNEKSPTMLRKGEATNVDFFEEKLVLPNKLSQQAAGGSHARMVVRRQPHASDTSEGDLREQALVKS
jgi:hypothetical protein